MTRMDCNEVRDLIAACVDDELAPSERAAVMAHADGCSSCAKALADLRALSRTVRSAGTYALPATVDARARAAIGMEERRSRNPGRRRILAIAATHAAALGVGALLAGHFFSQQSATDVLRRDAVAAHIRSLMGDQLLHVASADTHTVRPWFAGKLPFAPVVVDVADKDFSLLGGRVDYMLDLPVAALVYGRRKHRINVFVVPQDRALPSGTAMRNGYNLVNWRANGFSFVAVSDLNGRELAELARALGGPAEPTTPR